MINIKNKEKIKLLILELFITNKSNKTKETIITKKITSYSVK